MDLRKGVLPVAAITLLAGGAIFPRLLTYTPLPVAALSAQAAPARAPDSAPDPGTTQATDLLSDFFGVVTAGQPEAQRVAVLQQAAARSGVRVRFLMATVPDPIDSHAGWQFDTVLDAIQQGVSDTGWVLDRFYIPDVTATRDGPAVASGRAHERAPGVIVFRDTGEAPRQDCQASAACSEVLVLFLAAETPTAGVHQAAFARAVRFIAAWHPEPQTIPVLGPTFSGSSASIARAVAALSTELPAGSGFRFVSGSGTSRKNQAILQGAAPNVTFHATALPDDVLMTVPLNYLLGMSRDAWEHGVALLAESNTDYAHEVTDAVTLENLNLTVLPFPMHVSRLRSDAARAEAEPPSPSGQLPRFRPLSLAEAVSPTDQLPSLTPNTTSNYVELRLANILETVRRQDIRTVGIVATDARDKLFLAQELARHSPDVTLFTVENDLLYAHPQDAVVHGTGDCRLDLSAVHHEPVVDRRTRQQPPATAVRLGGSGGHLQRRPRPARLRCRRQTDRAGGATAGRLRLARTAVRPGLLPAGVDQPGWQESVVAGALLPDRSRRLRLHATDGRLAARGAGRAVDVPVDGGARTLRDDDGARVAAHRLVPGDRRPGARAAPRRGRRRRDPRPRPDPRWPQPG